LTLRLLLTIIFHNASSTDMAGTALLGDLETHSLDCRPCKFRFLQPWAQQGLTPKEWQDLEGLIYRYLSDPFVTQFSIGCELHPNDTLRRFCDAGMNSEDFLSFDTDNGKWVTRRGDKLTLKAQESLNYNRVVAITLQFHLRTMCVNTLKSFVQHGNESLARQVPEAQAESSPLPHPVSLVSEVTGFYPRPVRVAWLQDGEEVVLGWWLNSSEILPNADLTYQLRSSLAVEPGAGHSYACRVQHSSLGGQSLLIPWGRCTSWSLGAFPACPNLTWWVIAVCLCKKAVCL
uniref:Ig-like domain-containing protein n=1 Tax=Chelonoidis abingdonii TaxID=106734 RepID=A0A8C0G5T5_CHEAB